MLGRLYDMRSVTPDGSSMHLALYVFLAALSTLFPVLGFTSPDNSVTANLYFFIPSPFLPGPPAAPAPVLPGSPRPACSLAQTGLGLRGGGGPSMCVWTGYRCPISWSSLEVEDLIPRIHCWAHALSLLSPTRSPAAASIGPTTDPWPHGGERLGQR